MCRGSCALAGWPGRSCAATRDHQSCSHCAYACRRPEEPKSFSTFALAVMIVRPSVARTRMSMFITEPVPPMFLFVAVKIMPEFRPGFAVGLVKL